jgi:hypothetical protein
MRHSLLPFPIAICLLAPPAPLPLHAQPCPRASAGVGDPLLSALAIEDPYLAERVRQLELRAPLLRAALDSVRAGCVDVRVGTVEGMGGSVRWLPGSLPPDDLAQTAARVDTGTQAVREMVVRVDMRAIARHLRGRVPSPETWFSRSRRQARFDGLVDAVLIHELWAHLVPVAIGGSVRFLCPDPLPGQADLQSCSLRRENELRAQLGLAPRTQYSIDAAW